MAPRFLLDTNIWIYIRKNRTREITERFDRLAPGEAALSIITYGELHYGAAKSGRESKTLDLLKQMLPFVPVLPLPETAAREYGEIRADLERDGQVIGSNDLWIAAHARAAGLILVTNNEREFLRIPGLKIQNWVKGAP